MLRALLLADVVGLAGALLGALLLSGGRNPAGAEGAAEHLALFLVVLPAWVLAATALGVHRRDSYRSDHATVEDLVGVFQFVTTGAWLFVIAAAVTGFREPDLGPAVTMWAIALASVPAARAIARAGVSRSRRYVQNTIIVGAGDVGRLVARKLTRHPEYGLRLVGFVDDAARNRRDDPDGPAIVGAPAELRSLVRGLEVDRVIIAFPERGAGSTLDIARDVEDLDVQIDVVPRLFELLTPNVLMHRIEGLPLTGVPPARRSRSALLVKRVADVVVAAFALLLVSPLLVYVAWRTKHDSPGPVLFRQTRLGLDMREFTVLKFRTMKVDTDEEEHRRYIRELAEPDAAASTKGLFKLEREDAVTPFGRLLRRTSLDELPQLLNVLRGEMSLVGPRPCIPYETETFERHHFERFLVPAGITGLWQVTARSNSTFNEALEMDVAYVRGWSLGLDLRILVTTLFQFLRQGSPAL